MDPCYRWRRRDQEEQGSGSEMPGNEKGGPPPADTACQWSDQKRSLGQEIASFRLIDVVPPRTSVLGQLLEGKSPSTGGQAASAATLSRSADEGFHHPSQLFALVGQAVENVLPLAPRGDVTPLPYRAVRQSAPVPGLTIEHLAAVPREMPRLRAPVGPLRVTQGPAVVRHQPLLEPGRAVSPVGDDHDALPDGEGAQVERLVVQHAERQTVHLDVRAARLVPADVRGIQRDRYRPELTPDSTCSSPCRDGTRPPRPPPPT